jgi:hypothetical protein
MSTQGVILTSLRAVTLSSSLEIIHISTLEVILTLRGLVALESTLCGYPRWSKVIQGDPRWSKHLCCVFIVATCSLVILASTLCNYHCVCAMYVVSLAHTMWIIQAFTVRCVVYFSSGLTMFPLVWKHWYVVNYLLKSIFNCFSEICRITYDSGGWEMRPPWVQWWRSRQIPSQ